MTTEDEDGIIARITDILLEEEENKISCPHCHAWGVPGKQHTLSKSALFPTISCYNCKHEWVAMAHLKD